jgi:DNA-binding response OmpR family regulator
MAGAKQRILIIEDDSDIAALEKDYLEINDFEVVIENNGLKGMERALKEQFALVLLDLMLPGKDGMTICRNIREKVDIPILMVTARIEDIDKVRGLGLGADDYITKPFSPAELVARVKSHISRYTRLTKNRAAMKAPDELDFGDLRISHAARQVFVNDSEIILTRKEFELL